MTKPQSMDQALNTLQEIRSMMERSSRFISLSGLSGVTAGLFALLGATLAFIYLDYFPFEGRPLEMVALSGYDQWGLRPLQFFVLDAGLTLAGALAGAIYFTTKQARRKGLPIWDKLTRRLLANLLLPLGVGGVFVLALLYHGFFGLIAPACLIFYGLALINASKYTLNDIRYLGIGEVALGLLGAFVIGYGLEIWTMGFGLLHIAYGILMYVKYEQ